MTSSEQRDSRSREHNDMSRRSALKCLAWGAAGTAFTLAGGVITPVSMAVAATGEADPLFFVQLSDTHIGFHKDANPDVAGTLQRAIAHINALPRQPALVLHTGDITHLSRPEEFDTAAQLLSGLRATELHTVPGEHDVADAEVRNYFDRYGAPSEGRGYYAFDHAGVHFLALNNVMHAADGGAGALGPDQLAWALADLAARGASTPIVVMAHMPLWDIYPAWGWATPDAAPLRQALQRFGSATVLNGHIHQVVRQVEGHLTLHTARSTAFPQPAPGVGAGPGPLKVPTEALARQLGVTSITIVPHPATVQLNDDALDAAAPASAS